jgi:hypothetical protein
VQLRAWAVETSRGDISDSLRDEQVILLCGMLFERVPGQEFRPAGRGSPAFIGKGGFSLPRAESKKLWPDEPFAFVDNVPFQITRGYTLAGVGESSARFLNRCLQEARWTARDYSKVKAENLPNALARLLKEYSTPAHFSTDDERYLFDQTKVYEIPRLSGGVRIEGGGQSTEVVTTKVHRLGRLEKLWVTVYGGVRPYRYVLQSQRDKVSVTLGVGTGEPKPANPFISQQFSVPWDHPEPGSWFVFEAEDALGAKLTQRIKVVDEHTAEVYGPSFTDASAKLDPVH